MSAFEISYVLLWVVTCVLLVAVAALYSAFGASKLQRASRIETQGPAVDETVPLPAIVDADELLADGSASRWIFTSPDCGYCSAVKSNLRDLRRPLTNTVVVCRGKKEDVDAWVSDLPDWVQVVTDTRGYVFKDFNVSVTPFYVRLDGLSRCSKKGILSDVHRIEQYEDILDEDAVPVMISN